MWCVFTCGTLEYMWNFNSWKKPKAAQGEVLPALKDKEDILNMSTEAEIVAYVESLDDESLFDLKAFAERGTTDECRSKGGIFSPRGMRASDLFIATSTVLRRKGLIKY